MSAIEWTDVTWNPVRGCSRVSQGCVNCYAERQAIRQAGPGRPYEGLVRSSSTGPRWTSEIVFDEEKLLEPLSWRKPRRVFVNSMSDLFHERLSMGVISRILAVVDQCPQHTFQVLTKRAHRMPEFFGVSDWGRSLLPNLWLGVSVENRVNVPRLVHLTDVYNAGARFVSVEPLLQHVSIAPHLGELDWVIVGGESGPRARPCNVAWVRSIVQECRDAGVPVFVKQLGAHVVDRNDGGFDGDTARDWPMGTETEGWSGLMRVSMGAPCRVLLRSRKGGDPDEWPEDLRVREMPRNGVSEVAP